MRATASEPNAARQRLEIGLALVILPVFFDLTNPYWYGDAIWYALDVASGTGRLPYESGHLLWRPLAYVMWRGLHAVGIGVDPLEVLRALSALATGLVCVFTWRLAAALTASEEQGVGAAAVVATSKMCLVYGGSGSSYTAAMAFSTLAFLPLVRDRSHGWGARDGAAACAAITFAWACWGTAVLVAPGLLVAALLRARGTIVQRLVRTVALGAAIGAAISALAISAWACVGDPIGGVGFLDWLRASSHGRPMSLSAIGSARAVYGFLVSFVHLGETGTVVKGVLHGGGVSLAVIGAFGLALAAAVLASVALVSFARSALADDGFGATRTREIAAIAVATVAPVVAFAIAWKGSDIERFSLALPLLAIVAVHGLASSRAAVSLLRGKEGRAGLALAAVLALVNLGTFVLPTLASGGGLPMAVGRVASEHLPPASVLVVAGNEIMAEPMGPAFYFHGIRVYSITWDVLDKGLDGYQVRLQEALDRARAGGGGIAVLSDLVGEPTPGGIGLDPREHRRPTLEEIASFFASYSESGQFEIDRYRFVVMQPPSGSAGLPRRRQAVDLNTAGKKREGMPTRFPY